MTLLDEAVDDANSELPDTHTVTLTLGEVRQLLTLFRRREAYLQALVNATKQVTQAAVACERFAMQVTDSLKPTKGSNPHE